MTEERDTWTMGWPFPGLEVPYEEPPLTSWEKVAYAVSACVARPACLPDGRVLMYSLATDYQTLLEHYRRNPDDEGIRVLLAQTWAAMATEWIWP
jgi:hypothetical protein